MKQKSEELTESASSSKQLLYIFNFYHLPKAAGQIAVWWYREFSGKARLAVYPFLVFVPCVTKFL